MEYIVEQESDYDKFIADVNASIKEWFKPIGGVSIYEHQSVSPFGKIRWMHAVYSQAMIKDDWICINSISHDEWFNERMDQKIPRYSKIGELLSN